MTSCMPSSKQMGLVLLLSLILAAPVVGANAAPLKKMKTPALPEEARDGAQQVLAKARTATHVSARALSRVIVGRALCNGPDGNYRTDISSPPGGRLWFRQTHPGKGAFEALIDGDGSWAIQSDGSKKPLNYRRTLMVRSHDFQRIALDPESFATNLGLAGTVDFHGLQSDKLMGFTDDGTKVEFFYDLKTGLPLGFKMLNLQQAGSTITIIFQEWKEVEGVRMPSTVLATDSRGDFHLFFKGLFFDDVMP